MISLMTSPNTLRLRKFRRLRFAMNPASAVDHVVRYSTRLQQRYHFTHGPTRSESLSLRKSRSGDDRRLRKPPAPKGRDASRPARAIDERPATPPLPTKVQTVAVTADEADMRVDRFLEARFPGLSFSHIQRIIRKGELRVDGKRADSKDRLEAGQAVRIPPLQLDAPKPSSGLSEAAQKTLAALKEMTLFEDDDVLVLNKPAGLAVQGGSGTTHHVDRHAGGDARLEGAAAAPGASARQGDRPAACWSPRRASPHRRWPNRSARVRRARSTGRWSPACRSRSRAASRPTSPRKSARTIRSCASPSTATKARATR